MNADLLVIIVGVLTLIIGIFIGTRFFKFYSKKQEKKILKNLNEVIEGKRKNIIKIDGVEHEVSRFLIKDKDGNTTLVDLKGGEVLNEEKELGEIIEEVRKEVKDSPTPKEDSKITRENSGCSREKKRITRARGSSRIRRFG